jgi:hypothetical protein
MPRPHRSVGLQHLRPLLIPTAALLTAALIACLLHAGRIIPQSSDTAIVALEAQDILYRGARPVFYPGSEYAGALQQYLLALAFWFLPDGETVQFLVGLAMFLTLGALLLRVTWRLGGPGALPGAAFYFALGPFYLYYRGLLADGPYQPIFLLGALTLALLVEIAARAERNQAIDALFPMLGGVIGLAWWTHPIALAALIAATVAAVAGGWWRRVSARNGFGAVLAFFAGSAPWWARNLQTGFATLRGEDARRATFEQSIGQLRVLLDDGLPLFAGFGRLPWSGGPSPLVWSVLGALWLMALGLFFARRRSSPSAALHRTFGGFALLFPLLALGIALASPRGSLGDPRFLYPIFFFVVPTAGALFARLGPRRGAPLGLGIAALHGLGYFGTTPGTDWRSLSNSVEVAGVHGVYADYFTASMITLETKGRVIGTPFGTGALVRRATDRSFVDGLRNPSFLLTSADADRLQRFATAQGKAGTRRAVSADLELLSDLPAAALPILRGCYCVPSGLGPEAVSWGALDASPLKDLRAGQRAKVRVEVRNGADLTWLPTFRLSYHWRLVDGSMVVFDGLRTELPRPLPPGETAMVSVLVQAPDRAGRYEVEFDVVEEGVAWFSTAGSAGPRAEVVVR